MEAIVNIFSLIFFVVIVCAPSSLKAFPRIPSNFFQEFPEILDRDLNPLESASHQGGVSLSVDEGTISSDSASTTGALESKALEQISQVFGIGNRSGNKERSSKKPKREGTPSFMLNLYNSIANSSNGESRAATPYQATTIRCVTNERGRRKKRDILNFKVDTIPITEQLLNAELYIFRMKSRSTDVTGKPKYYQVGIYQRTSTDVTNLIDSRQVPSHGTGWEIFNVERAVSEWLVDDAANFGFYINVTLPSGERVPEGAVRFSLKKEETKPNLVIFTTERHIRNDLSVEMTEYEDALPQLSDENLVSLVSPTNSQPLPTNEDPQTRSKREAKGVKICGIEEMFVDFERLGWSHRIIAPVGFIANKCTGECPFPAKYGIPYSTHALVQSFMAVGSTDIAQACCVPHELRSLTFLYYDDMDNIVLKRVKNAVAVKCGCH